MTLFQAIGLLETAAMNIPVVGSIVANDIYALNDQPDALYGAFGWTQGQHQLSSDRNMMTYAFTLFWIDRLAEDQSNRERIQSEGVSVLSEVIRQVKAQGAVTFTTFNERFADECAGVMCNIEIIGKADTLCTETPYELWVDANEWVMLTSDGERIMVRKNRYNNGI